MAPDGSQYVVLTDGAGNLAPASGGSSGNPNGQATMANSAPVVIASNQSAVPISASTLPLPTGAATAAGISTVNTTLGSPFQAGGSIANTAFGVTGSVAVTGTFFQATQPVSGTVAVSSIIPGSAATNLGKAEDSAHSSGDVGVFGLALANEAQTVLAQDGDYIGHGADTKGNTFVIGPVASGATDSGGPVKIGGRNNTTLPTLTDGQRGDVQLDTRGGLYTVLKSANSTASATINQNGADSYSNSNIAGLDTLSFSMFYNGASWDRIKGDAIGGLWVGNEARTTNKTATANGGNVRPIATTIGAAVNKPFQVPELDWSYPAAAGGISNTTTAVTMVGAAGSGIRNYLTAIQLSAPTLGAATEVAVRDGAGGTVIWRGFMSTAGGNQSVNLSSPVKSTANTLLEVVTLSATVTGAVYINAQGYQAP